MKLKTKKIVAKRFKVTKSGLIMRRRQGLRHLRSNKSRKSVRRLNVLTTVNKGLANTVRAFLPYN